MSSNVPPAIRHPVVERATFWVCVKNFVRWLRYQVR